MTHPALVNPFMSLSNRTAAGTWSAAPANPAPGLEVGAATYFTNAAPVPCTSHNHGERDPSVMPDSTGAAAGYPCCHDCGVREPCDEHCPEHGRTLADDLRDISPRFELDPAAFMSEVEPVPAFLTRPIDNRAEQVEEMLELARADEWPAPPRRMRA